MRWIKPRVGTNADGRSRKRATSDGTIVRIIASSDSKGNWGFSGRPPLLGLG